MTEKIYLCNTPTALTLHWSEAKAMNALYDYVCENWSDVMPAGKEIPTNKGLAARQLRRWNVHKYGCLGIDELELPERGEQKHPQRGKPSSFLSDEIEVTRNGSD